MHETQNEAVLQVGHSRNDRSIELTGAFRPIEILFMREQLIQLTYSIYYSRIY